MLSPLKEERFEFEEARLREDTKFDLEELAVLVLLLFRLIILLFVLLQFKEVVDDEDDVDELGVSGNRSVSCDIKRDLVVSDAGLEDSFCNRRSCAC